MKKLIIVLICCILATTIAGFALGKEFNIVISILAVLSGCIFWLAGRSYPVK